MNATYTIDTQELQAQSLPASMHALVYRGPGRPVLERREVPSLSAPTDAIVKVLKTTICGTDLHILKGDVPAVEEGRVLGHEGVGIVQEVGSAVTEIKPGDHVLISCISACAKCEYCRKGMYSHCITGGWILGHLIDGTQAEYVRIPYADTSLYRIPRDADEDSMVMLSDVFPTALECGVLNGKVEPGKTVAIVGCGPIGLAALLTAQFYSPAAVYMIDVDPTRRAFAHDLGATETISAGRAYERLMRITRGRGVDTVIEAVGTPTAFVLCQNLVGAGGVIANIGVHGSKADIHLERLWSANITITTRLVDTATTPFLLKSVSDKRIEPRTLVTHRFSANDFIAAYDTFGRAAETQALKVLITL